MTKKEEAEILFDKAIQTYEDNPGILMREILDKYLSKYSDDEVKELKKIISELINDATGSSSGRSYDMSSFEIEVENLYKEFISSDSIESLSYSIKKLKKKFDYFKKNFKEEKLVMPISNYPSLNIEIDDLEYGLSHWNNIKKFIVSSSNKQVDIQHGLDLDKQKLSTFFYMLDKLGFIEKETLKNRVYIKKITDKGNI